MRHSRRKRDFVDARPESESRSCAPLLQALLLLLVHPLSKLQGVQAYSFKAFRSNNVVNYYRQSPRRTGHSSSWISPLFGFQWTRSDVSVKDIRQTLPVKLTSSSEDTEQADMEDAAEVDAANVTSSIVNNDNNNNNNNNKDSIRKFDILTALFCGGLAFDSYVEPPANSSRWERGSKGLNVAFLSSAFTRNVYKGLLEVTPIRCIDLPNVDQNAVEQIVTGKGIDTCVLVAALEGSWKEDIEFLKREEFNEGVLDLTGAAHVGRSKTAWANINEAKSKDAKRRTGKASPYSVPSGWGKGAQAVWPEEEPFYLYLQDPATVRLVFTILDADRIGEGTPVGSVYKELAELIPQARLTPEQAIEEMKKELMENLKNGGSIDDLNDAQKMKLGAKTWRGSLKLTSKPRKKDKNSQIMTGAAAGAYVAGPAGAAVGALVGGLYEGRVQGAIELRLRYLPIPQVSVPRKKYQVLGGMPGIDWGTLFDKYRSRNGATTIDSSDLEHCFFISHDKTGATCAVYRSLQYKLIVVSFRGTCAPIDLLTDVSIAQDAWVDGEDVKDPETAKVHAGFRNSLNSISRRLKELILAAPAPGDEFGDYDVLVTGHSLGGALATLFTADIAEYGVDAGRNLPQMVESDPWWKGIMNTFMGQEGQASEDPEPPRPKSLHLYSFGSPRVGNEAFANRFDSLISDGSINSAYRIVNGEDVVARLPRTMNALGLAKVSYEHCGPTVLLTQIKDAADSKQTSLLWIEGESDDSKCPVRDGVAITSPMEEGNLLAELFGSEDESDSEAAGSWSKLVSAANKLSKRVNTLTASDIASVLGIQKDFTDRELKMVESLVRGRALAHHMEDEYYSGMGGAAGFVAKVGSDVIEISDEST